MDLAERLFNYRISRGRRVVENIIGILTSRFRIYQRSMQQKPPVVARWGGGGVMACLVLYNLLRIRCPTQMKWMTLGQKASLR